MPFLKATSGILAVVILLQVSGVYQQHAACA